MFLERLPPLKTIICQLSFTIYSIMYKSLKEKPYNLKQYHYNILIQLSIRDQLIKFICLLHMTGKNLSFQENNWLLGRYSCLCLAITVQSLLSNSGWCSINFTVCSKKNVTVVNFQYSNAKYFPDSPSRQSCFFIGWEPLKEGSRISNFLDQLGSMNCSLQPIPNAYQPSKQGLNVRNNYQLTDSHSSWPHDLHIIW